MTKVVVFLNDHAAVCVSSSHQVRDLPSYETTVSPSTLCKLKQTLANLRKCCNSLWVPGTGHSTRSFQVCLHTSTLPVSLANPDQIICINRSNFETIFQDLLSLHFNSVQGIVSMLVWELTPHSPVPYLIVS